MIEIGLAYASSALAIAEALIAIGSDEAKHLIIDVHQDLFHGAGWEAIVQTGLDCLCSLIPERSQIA
ncbi:MAG TPA: hypothetical protein VEH29_16645, partial [Acidimicrobiales bacterium]|nr:hypothetical protein [Acidimicrobiales bacterium]